ncbi:tigger transposable element-derived protein 4-like [Hydra vulgaris]|uniref:Tigger transposable element-derived protein 4-like n=1 Tax=Hydra vulgaris TaxID=6087 RepID=A0ABM4C8U1_HYDVU
MQGIKSKCMRIKEGTFSNLDNLVFKWLLNARSRDVAVSAILKIKSRELAEKININGFQASDSWFDCWKNRYNVSFKMVPQEVLTVLSQSTANVHLFGSSRLLPNRCMQPYKSLNLQSETCLGGKHSKICLTGMVAAGAVGDKIPMFVIGKSKSPCCLKGIKHLPCRYRNQNKSWMDGVLFEEWIREMDTKFTKEKKEAFIMDNCPAHLTIDKLKSIKLIFLTTEYHIETSTNKSGSYTLFERLLQIFGIAKAGHSYR